MSNASLPAIDRERRLKEVKNTKKAFQLITIAADAEAGILAAKAKGIGQNRMVFFFSRFIGYIIKITFRIL